MEYEFDKEIDSILRQARPETIVSERFNAHIDADEISLFAENALTQKAKMRVTEHLADCAKCRKILSNVIALNAEESSEIVHTEEAKTLVSPVPIPWYRRFFAFPQLAFTIGGLTVLLAGMIGYVVLQSYQQPQDASIAQMEKTVERPQRASGASSDGDSVTIETYSANSASNVSPSPAANMAISNAANSASKSNVPTENFNSTAAAPTKKDQPAAEVQATPSALNEIATADAVKNEAEAENKEAKAAENAGRTAQQDYSRNSLDQNQTQIMPDSRNVQTRRAQNFPIARSAPQPMPQAPAAISTDAVKPKSADDKKELAEKSRNVAGKNFVYRNGAWYDKSYKQQKTVNISRNSDEYKKLDTGLRAVADNLGGTVVVVWKSTAYRIQ